MILSLFILSIFEGDIARTCSTWPPTTRFIIVVKTRSIIEDLFASTKHKILGEVQLTGIDSQKPWQWGFRVCAWSTQIHLFMSTSHVASTVKG